MQRMVSLASEFGFVIALPLICFGLLGKWLDARYHTHKAFTLVGILLALIASVVFLSKRIMVIRKELSPPPVS